MVTAKTHAARIKDEPQGLRKEFFERPMSERRAYLKLGQVPRMGVFL
jgi:hypothetical protein